MQIDIIKIAEALAAGSAILAAIIGAYKLYDKLIDELADLILDKKRYNI